ncbi:MAG: TonB-dependent receptor [Saprospiraceae bacterium]|nr:TonB-dependent receptor [Saprospiraceae bacterium]
MRSPALIIIHLIFSVAVFAQDAIIPLNDTTLLLKEVVISATRHHSSRKNIPYATDILPEKNIEYFLPRSTPEALTGMTGILVQKTNHGGGSAFVRGLTGNQTLTIIDGIRLNNPTFRYGPNQYLNTIDPYSIDKIEVVRGSGSVQYGSDALGGVIHILTKEPAFNDQPKFKGGITGKVMSQDMEYTGIPELEFQSKKITARFGLTVRSFGDLVGGKNTGIQSPSGYNEHSIDTKIKWKIKDRILLTGAYQSTAQNKVPLYHKVSLENFEYYYFDPQIRQLGYVKLNIEPNQKWINKINITSSLQNSKESRKYHKLENEFKYNESDKVLTFGNTLDIFSNIAPSWSANTGVEYYYSLVNSSRTQIDIQNNTMASLRGLYPDDAAADNLSAYTLHHFKAGRFNFEAGLRYNHFIISIPNSDPQLAGGDNIRVKPSSLVSNLGLLYQLGAGHYFSLTHSTGYRAPNIDDLGTLGLVDFRYEIPAYNLKPEKSHNVEIGYRFIGKSTRVDLSLFQMNLRDLITREKLEDEFVDGYNVYIKENSQKSVIRGFEFSLEHQLTEFWSFQTSTTYTYGQNLSKDEPMRRIPPLFGRNALQYQNDSWRITVEHLFAGSQKRLSGGDIDDNRIPDGGTPGWNIINAYVSYPLKTLDLRLGLQNLFNKDYRTHGSGINGVGRSVFLAVSWNLLTN